MPVKRTFGQRLDALIDGLQSSPEVDVQRDVLQPLVGLQHRLSAVEDRLRVLEATPSRSRELLHAAIALPEDSPERLTAVKDYLHALYEEHKPPVPAGPCATGPFVDTSLSQYLTQQPPQRAAVTFHTPSVTADQLAAWRSDYGAWLMDGGDISVPPMEYLAQRINRWFSSIADQEGK